MMIRQDFEQLADALRGCRPDVMKSGLHAVVLELDTWENCVDAVAAACVVSNPAFDFTKFADRAKRF